jgi:outer membrane protein
LGGGMKKYLISLILPALILAKEIKIGFVESKKVFNEYQATVSANSQFNEFVGALRDSAGKIQDGLEKLKNELEAQKLMLSEEARLKKMDEIESLNKSYNQFLQDIFGPGGKVEQKNDELMTPLLKKINDAVSKVAQQEGFAIVMDLTEGVYYASGDLNLTDLVVKELNREYGPQTLPTGHVKPTIAVFYLHEENDEAKNIDLGQTCQNELYNALKTMSNNYNTVSSNQVNTEVLKKNNSTPRNVDDTQAIAIGASLLCDYIVLGKVSKSGTRIEFTIILKEIKGSREIGRQSSTVTEDIKLTEALNNDLRMLLALVKSQE